MIYTVRYHPDVAAIDLPRIDAKTARQIGTAIDRRLTIGPSRYGAPLRHTLKGYWKLRIGDFRVVYRIVGHEVRVVAIFHRSRVYEIVKKRVQEIG